MFPELVRESKERRAFEVREKGDSGHRYTDDAVLEAGLIQEHSHPPLSCAAALGLSTQIDMRPSASACVRSGSVIVAQESGRLAVEQFEA
jgi:hypothetical protein